MERQPYSTDLSDKEWELLVPFIPAPLPGGRPAKWERREIVNAILYVLRTGCQWHLLPHDFPPYQTVFYYFRQWRRSGVSERLNTALRNKFGSKVGETRNPVPPLSIVKPSKRRKKGAEGL